MPVEDLLRQLSDADVVSRLDAARLLEAQATVENFDVIKRLASAESDDLVRHILSRIVDDLAKREVSVNPDADEPEATATTARAAGVRDAIGMMLHEITPLVGEIEVVANGRLDDYVGSELEQAIEAVRQSLLGFDDLRSAAESHDFEDINLTDAIHAIVRAEAARAPDVLMRVGNDAGEPAADEELSDRMIEVLPTRIDPVFARASARLLSLILSNVLRNAFEACRDCVSERDVRITVSWGVTDRDVWVSVIDDCTGLPTIDVWRSGESTKGNGHRGMGLAIVRQAVDSLGAKATLTDNDPRGVTFEVRWPISQTGDA